MIAQNSRFTHLSLSSGVEDLSVLLLFTSIVEMDFAVGENIEAVDECGVWHYAKIVDKREDSVVVTFPPWKPDWDREIFDALEIRERTTEEVLVPRRFANNKVSKLNFH